MTEEDWIAYWTRLHGRLNDHINKLRNADAEEYITSCFAYFSFITEELSSKIKKHQTFAPFLNPLLIESHDLLRGNIACQQHLLLASTAFNLRASFEILCTMKYILTRPNPDEAASRYNRFAEIEKLKGLRESPNLAALPRAQEDQIKKICPEWINPTTGDLFGNPHWSGERNLDLKEICKRIGMSEEYVSVYKMTSKFNHASPIIVNLYRQPKGLGVIPTMERTTSFALMATHNCMETLRVFCEFFDVSGFDKVEYAKIQMLFLRTQKALAAKGRKAK